MRSGDEHYPSDLVGGARSLPGAGILAWITDDQLHPPMLFDAGMWRDGSKWADGARQYVLELGKAAELRDNEHVLDIGSGVCGPARALAEAFGVRVTAITNSVAHAETSERQNELNGDYTDKIRVKLVSRADDWPEGPYDVALSINMLYQVADHQELYGRVCDALASGGRFVLDDWMATDQISETDLRIFEHHFQFRNLVRLSRVESELTSVGFYPAARLLDRGETARGPMQQYFRSTMIGYFLPMLAREWPDGREDGMSGRQMVMDLIAAVEHTQKLYMEGKLTYRTLICFKP